jgi:hypothetical protein
VCYDYSLCFSYNKSEYNVGLEKRRKNNNFGAECINILSIKPNGWENNDFMPNLVSIINLGSFSTNIMASKSLPQSHFCPSFGLFLFQSPALPGL